MEAVKISNLSYKYPSADEYCLKNVSFSVSEGEVCAIVGPNGCGKTTICNIIRGLIPSFHGGEVEGSVEIFGKSTKEISEEEKAKRIGFVFQNPFTQNSGIKETVFEEIAFGLENMGVDREEIITKVMDIISLLQIEAFMFKHPCERTETESRFGFYHCSGPGYYCYRRTDLSARPEGYGGCIRNNQISEQAKENDSFG